MQEDLLNWLLSLASWFVTWKAYDTVQLWYLTQFSFHFLFPHARMPVPLSLLYLSLSLLFFFVMKTIIFFY